MAEVKKGYPLSKIIIIAVFIAVIFVLAFLLFYYSEKNISWASNQNVSASKNSSAIQASGIISTNVIHFAAPEILPEIKTTGDCEESSVAQPYRQDAWRCIVQDEIYDPCFTVAEKDLVFCPADPSKTNSILIKLENPLPKPFVPAITKNNWAWFLKLADGTYCSPFTGTLPPLKDGVASYGCSGESGKVLLGDLNDGTVWTAKEAILVQSGQNWVVKSSQQIAIDTVWQ